MTVEIAVLLALSRLILGPRTRTIRTYRTFRTDD
jgi:hypothetical protein